MTSLTVFQRSFSLRLERCTAVPVGCLVLLLLGTPNALADVCSVPSAAHPTIQAAVDDASCTEIVVVAQATAESVAVTRSLLLRGGSSSTTAIVGQVTVTGASTEVTLHDLRVDGGGCFAVALDVTDGAQVTSEQDIVIVNATEGPCPIFVNGFESGNAFGWSTSGP
jgi:hypothetical protein